MIEYPLFLFYIIQIFNGVEDIDWNVKVLSDSYVLSYHYCGYDDKLIWGCTDGYNRTIYLSIYKIEDIAFCYDYQDCDLLQHEMIHAQLYEICAINIGYADYWTQDFCIEYSKWHG